MSDQRRLTAVLFIDIQGYSAMMQQDESRSMLVLSGFRKAVDSMLAQHGGQKIQDLGDGSLIIFDSAVKALQGAIQLQRELMGLQIPARIGLHHGDVIFREGNIFGDSVNIASRIESAGKAGSILFSQDMYNLVKNQPFQTKLVGTFRFKNITDPLSLYAVANDEFVIPSSDDIKAKLPDQQRPGNGPAVRVFRSKWSVVLAGLALAFLIFRFLMTDGVLAEEQIWLGEWHQERETENGLVKEGILSFRSVENGMRGIATLSYGETELTDTLIDIQWLSEGKVIEGKWISELPDQYGRFRLEMNDDARSFSGYYSDHDNDARYQWEGEK